jgi:hypothetical protein
MTSDVAGVISLNLFMAPVDDNVTANNSLQSTTKHDGKCVPTKTMWVAVGFPYGPGFARAYLRSGSRTLARVALVSLALSTLTMCA